MNLYRIMYDGQWGYVEAEDFTAAIGKWRAHVMVKWGDDYSDSDQPESVERVHDEAVIR